MTRADSPDVVVVGAGIVGLAHALAAARRGLSVVVLERSERAIGASIRNFGMFWPIAQPHGPLLRRAMRSREVWLEAAAGAGFAFEPCGSLHAACHEDELAVLREIAASRPGTGCEVLSPEAAVARSPGLVARGLLGALFSPAEGAIDPRQAIAALPGWLARVHGVRFRFSTLVTHVEPGLVRSSAGDAWAPQHVFVCNGDDLQTLYPALFADSGLTRCKLQMMRTAPVPGGWRLGPHLAAGLTLAHYPGFGACPTLPVLRRRLEREFGEHLRLGIHVLVAQNQAGELVLGDSHEYGRHFEPFNQESTDRLILDYLARFFAPPEGSLRIAQRWHGTYAKSARGQAAFIASPAPGNWVVTGLGGGGMTISFGLAEEVMAHALDAAPAPFLGP